MLKTISALAALTAASAFVLPTVSQAEETNIVRVSYADLNRLGYGPAGASAAHCRRGADRVRDRGFAPARAEERDQRLPQRCHRERDAGL